METTIKNKSGLLIALFFLLVLGAGAMMAMKPSRENAPAKNKAPKHTSTAAAKKFATSWFDYSGSGDPTDPANYTQVSGTPTCNAGTSVCAIRATNNGGSPDITNALASEINNDLSSHTPSANVKLKN